VFPRRPNLAVAQLQLAESPFVRPGTPLYYREGLYYRDGLFHFAGCLKTTEEKNDMPCPKIPYWGYDHECGNSICFG
jgi:hypothetical protein